MLAVLSIGILLLISVFTAYMPYYMQPAEASFSTKNVSDTAGFSSDPQIAVSDDHVYVVWVDFTPGNWDVFFRASNDDGATFSSTINLSNNAGESGRPRIAVSGDNVYVVWRDFTPGNWDVFFKASNDNGATFGSTVNLSNNTADSSNPKRSDLPQIAVSGDNVYVVWADHTPGNWDIFLRASNDDGATFGSVVNLSNGAGEASRPRIAVSGDNVYVVWRYSDDIFLRASNDDGATFGEAINLSNNTADSSNPKRSDLPQMAVSGDNVYVVWADYIPGDYNILFRASNDNGATFSNAVNLETTVGLADLPQIAVSDDHVYVLWDDFSLTEGLVIFLRASNDDGATFGSAVNLLRNVGYSDSTPVVVSGNNVYVISAIGNIDILLRASNDDGATFGSAVNLSNSAEASSDPQMAVSGDNVYVVWEDYAIGNPDIFFKTFIPSMDIQAVEKMVLLTDNGSIKVEVTMDRETLEPRQPVGFTLRFLHPLTEELLQHVNYSFMIMDENGNIIVNRLNMHAPGGTDTQSVTFLDTGQFTLSIDVAGLGVSEPYDSRHNGMASTALTVVPEFPLSVLAVMGVVLGTAIAITRFRRQLSQQ